MKKLYILTFCAIVFNFKLHGQADTTQTKGSRVDKFENPFNSNTFSGIFAMPIGNFGSNDVNTGGFATNGYGFAFDSKSYLTHGISFISHSSYSWVDLDSKSMSEELTKSLGLKTELLNGQHRPFFSTIGVNYDYYFNSRINFGVNAQAGILYNSFRPMEMKVYDANNSVIYSDILSFNSNFSFAYCFGANVTFAIIPHVLAFQLSADYSAGKLDTYLVSQNMEPIKSLEKLELLNLSAGLVFYSKK